MFELVAGLTVVFAGYVLYEVFKTVSETNRRPPVAGPAQEKAKLPPEAKAAAAKPVEVPKPAAEPVPEPVAEATAPPPAAEAAAEPASAPISAPPTDKVISTLRNPATGETCPVPTNYRFAKKWVKDALVAEGLLDRVYKAADLDDVGSQQVKEAIGRLKSIEKYQG
ncbi:hypothetical protein EWI61_11975 [Methylolobus aquaticus]|nr:hypothetical protein EWI61_11975 [Methylolobus aquaticus]